MTQHAHTQLHTPHLQKIATAAVACMLIGSATTANADLVETHWTNPAGGEFHEPANWSNGVPDSDACAIFDVPGFFPVTFEEFASSDRLVLRQGTVNLELGTATYELLNPLPQTSSLTIGEVDGDVAALLQTSGMLSTKFTSIGLDDGASGTVDLFGTGTQLAADFQLDVGDRGSGVLDINAGATIDAFSLTLGKDNSGIGEVVIFGNASSINANLFRVGMQGTGSMAILGGATVNSNDGSIAQQETALGSMLVHGPGSTWNIDGILDVGERNIGELTISNGSVVNVSASATVGTFNLFKGEWPPDFPAHGFLTVDGEGSLLDILDQLYIGLAGIGEMHITDGGTVLSNTGHMTGSDSIVVVDGEDSLWFVEETIEVAWPGNELAVRDGGEIDALSITTRGTIRGNSTITADIDVDADGIVEPGVEVEPSHPNDEGLILGELTIDGNYTQLPQSTLAISVRGGGFWNPPNPQEASQLTVTGSAMIEGTLQINVGNFEYENGDTFDILVADSVSGTFDDVIGDQPPGGGWVIEYLPDRVRLKALYDSPYDFNGDVLVGVADLLLLLENWGQCDEPCPPFCLGDANADCNVNTLDLLGLFEYWSP